MGKGKHQEAGEGCLPFDLDDVLAYETFRVVRIRDRRLGFAKILITLGIFVYVIIFELIIQQGYMIKEEPQGGVQTTLRRGAKHDTALPSYCRDGPHYNETMSIPCLWLDETEVLNPPGEEFSMFITTRVSILEETIDAGCQSPVYMQTIGNVKVTDLSGSDCPIQPRYADKHSELSRHFFVGEIEKFTMQWAHFVYGPVSKVVRHNTELKFGELRDSRTDEVLKFTPRGRGSKIATQGYEGISSGDIVSVQVLLDILDLGVDGLDRIAETSKDVDCQTDSIRPRCPNGCYWAGPDCSRQTTVLSCEAEPHCKWIGTPAPAVPIPPSISETVDVDLPSCQPDMNSNRNFCLPNTLRYDGGVFVIMIDYKTPEMSSSSMGYTYEARWIPRSEFKIIEKRVSGNQVTYWNRHGLRLVFIQTGFITKFSFQTMLLTLVTGFALFAVSKVVVELVIMRLLPAKHVYENYKYVTSKDFSDVKVTEDEKLGGCTDDDFIYGMLKPGAKQAQGEHAPDVGMEEPVEVEGGKVA